MDIIRIAIRQPVTVAVGIILIVLAGAISLTRLPIQLTPNVESTIITVSTFWEGREPGRGRAQRHRQAGGAPHRAQRAAADVELLSPERRLHPPRVRHGRRQGRRAARGQRQAARGARLPRRRGRAGDRRQRRGEPRLHRVDRLRHHRPHLRHPHPARLRGRPHRACARERQGHRGDQRPRRARAEVHIRIDPVRLAQYRITPTQFAQAIQDTNQNISAGQLADGKLDVRLRTVGQYDSLQAIERTVVTNSAAGPVRVGDVAEIIETFKEPTSFVRSRGEPVIAINAEREIGSNVMEVMQGLKDAIDKLNASGGLLDAKADSLHLDGGLYLKQVYDQTTYIDDAIALVRANIWLGGGLAILVLILFLRSVRTVGIIALAIPISIVGAVVAMVAMGRSINVVSLAGMAFAVGMVVDNAIVVLENIFRHLEMGKPARVAAYDGAREVWGAVLASTLTTIVVFIPILLIQEEAGQLFRDIALAICAAVGLSLVVSITVIPAASARLLKLRKMPKTSADGKPRGLSALIGRFIYLICGSVIARLAIIIVLTAVSVAGTLILRPPADYLPRGNRNLVFGLIIPPPGYNIEQMEDIAVRVEEVIGPFWEAGKLIDDPQAYAAAVAGLPSVPTFTWPTMAPGPPVVPPSLENYFLVSFDGILFHGGVSDDTQRVVDLLPLFTHATRAEQVPGVIAFPFQVPLFQLGGSTGSAVKLQLAGPDLDVITQVAAGLYVQLGGKYGFGSIQPVPSNFSLAGPEIQVRPDLVRLSELGLATSDIGLAVRAGG